MIDGRQQWFIWNETTTGENFAEKWNDDPRRAQSFFEWHARALSDIERLVAIDGLDNLTKSLSQSFGPGPANRAMASLTNDISTARAAGLLSVAPTVGLRINNNPWAAQPLNGTRSSARNRMRARPRAIPAAHQYLHLRTNPVCAGSGALRPGRLVWSFVTAPTPLSRRYRLRV